MADVLQLVRRLSAPAAPGQVPGVRLRNYAGPEDIEPWLRLRRRAFADEQVAVRQWTRADFERELLAKSWWSPERMWLANAVKGQDEAEMIGTATLAWRGRGRLAVPVVHWLCVDPAWRGRGIGALLMATLESHAWEAGYREIRLETHRAWQSALRLYSKLGYRPAPCPPE